MAEQSITLVGNLVRECELRYTTGGRAVASFGIAVNRRYQQDGEWQEEVSFFDCVAWGDLGENLAASASKGTRVVVFGRLQQRSWEQDDGTKRSKVEVIADDVGASLRWAQTTIERTTRTKTERAQEGDPI